MKSSILRCSMIFLLYCTAISFFLIGIQLFREEQTAGKRLQAELNQSVSGQPLFVNQTAQNAPEHSQFNRAGKMKSHPARCAGHQSALADIYLSVPLRTKKQLLQKGIARNVIRLHIKANSNSTKDQLLKLHVRNAVIADLQSCLKKSTSRKNAEEILISRLADIRQTAEKQIRDEGAAYTVKISLSDRLFPQKTYGDLTFPAGIYRALCIEIGNGEGHNWWCVLFPSLCFVDETTAIVPKQSKKMLKKNLTKEEYELLNKPPEAHSLFFDWFSAQKH